MEHQIIRVVDFEIVGPYTLRILFEDGAERTIDFESTLQGHYFAPLIDIELFNSVRLDPEIQTLVWPNDAAHDPATLYNWRRGDGAGLAARAKGWSQRSIAASNV